MPEESSKQKVVITGRSVTLIQVGLQLLRAVADGALRIGANGERQDAAPDIATALGRAVCALPLNRRIGAVLAPPPSSLTVGMHLSELRPLNLSVVRWRKARSLAATCVSLLTIGFLLAIVLGQHARPKTERGALVEQVALRRR